MPYTTSVAGTTITASWANTNLRDQVVNPFSGTTARDAAITAPVEGMLTFQNDSDRFTTYNGTAWVDTVSLAAWTTYAPTLTQGVTVSKTATYARYVRFGRTIKAMSTMLVSSAGTSGSAIIVGLPVACVTGPAFIGTVSVVRSGASVLYHGGAAISTTTSVTGNRDASANLGIGSSPVFALASGDFVYLNVEYEAAAST